MLGAARPPPTVPQHTGGKQLLIAAWSPCHGNVPAHGWGPPALRWSPNHTPPGCSHPLGSLRPCQNYASEGGPRPWQQEVETQRRPAQRVGDTITALSPAVGPIPRSRIKATQPDPLPGAARHGAHPISPPWGEGAPTLDTVMGFPKSLPPVMRKPQGAGPAKVTVTGMVAGGSGQAGSGGVGKSRGALCSSGRHSPAARPAPHPEGPKHGVTESGSAFLPGRGPVSLCCHKVPAATAASSCRPAVPSWGWWLPPSGGHEGTHCWLRWCSQWDGAGEVTPLSLAQGRKSVPARQFVARQGQASGVWRGRCGCEGSQQPARDGSCCSPQWGGCKRQHPEPFAPQQTRTGKGC